MGVLMGAPNVMRGGSHSGNVSARTLAEAGLLDILSSDYIPFSLIQSAFFLGSVVDSISLPQAVAMVSRNPAEAVGLLVDHLVVVTGLAQLDRGQDAGHAGADDGEAHEDHPQESGRRVSLAAPRPPSGPTPPIPFWYTGRDAPQHVLCTRMARVSGRRRPGSRRARRTGRPAP